MEDEQFGTGDLRLENGDVQTRDTCRLSRTTKAKMTVDSKPVMETKSRRETSPFRRARYAASAVISKLLAESFSPSSSVSCKAS